MSFQVELPIAPSVAGAVEIWRDPSQTAIDLKEVSKFLRVEPFVPDEDHGLGQRRQEMFGSGGFSGQTREQEESYDVSSFINGLDDLRVVFAFGEPNRLILRASSRFSARLMDLDKSAVDITEFACWLSSLVSKNFRPNSGIDSKTPTAVDCVQASPVAILPARCEGLLGAHCQRSVTSIVHSLFCAFFISLVVMIKVSFLGHEKNHSER